MFCLFFQIILGNMNHHNYFSIKTNVSRLSKASLISNCFITHTIMQRIHGNPAVDTHLKNWIIFIPGNMCTDTWKFPHPSACIKVLKNQKRHNIYFVYGLFYDQGTRSVSFEVKNDVFQMFDINAFVL